MIYLLKNLRIISVIGCVMSLIILIINIISMLFIKQTSTYINYSWVTFFSIALCSFLASIVGYILNYRYQFKRRHYKKEGISI